MKSGETGNSSLKKRRVETDWRQISEAELLEPGDPQEYFGVIKKIEELSMISRFTAWESLYVSEDFLHQVLT